MAVFAFWAGLDADSKIGGAIRSAVAARAASKAAEAGTGSGGRVAPGVGSGRPATRR